MGKAYAIVVVQTDGYGHDKAWYIYKGHKKTQIPNRFQRRGGPELDWETVYVPDFKEIDNWLGFNNERPDNDFLVRHADLIKDEKQASNVAHGIDVHLKNNYNTNYRVLRVEVKV